jgi:hypothetical protein
MTPADDLLVCAAVVAGAASVRRADLRPAAAALVALAATAAVLAVPPPAFLARALFVAWPAPVAALALHAHLRPRARRRGRRSGLPRRRAGLRRRARAAPRRATGDGARRRGAGRLPPLAPRRPGSRRQGSRTPAHAPPVDGAGPVHLRGLGPRRLVRQRSMAFLVRVSGARVRDVGRRRCDHGRVPLDFETVLPAAGFALTIAWMVWRWRARRAAERRERQGLAAMQALIAARLVADVLAPAQRDDDGRQAQDDDVRDDV